MVISPLEDVHFLTDAVVREVSHYDKMSHLAAHCLIKVDPEFPLKVRPDDFPVGNRGWDGETAMIILPSPETFWQSAVLCKTTTVAFKRSFSNHGLLIVEILGIFSHVKLRDELELYLKSENLRNIATGMPRKLVPYPKFILQIFDGCGIYQQLRRDLARGVST